MINNIEISCYDIDEPEWLEKADSFCKKILDFIKRDNWEISLLFTTDDYIHQLNREYRMKDSPTDVLSFCQTEDDDFPRIEGALCHAGDIVISLDYLEKNSLDFNVPPEEELKRVLIHGVLHLAGYDHNTNAPEEQMIILQEKILRKIGEEW